ncbi:potassium channel family protein [Alienimonas californiensis]|uniref:Ion channel n=1 Tax=Alienimonas californiensis TaxID=2527989 RepID=A0A517PB70_9PLAN|nr:potassium channel family protein [Alienimonas californiensis]QDT16591.1 Ion channel [Alienimonas californiensis]
MSGALLQAAGGALVLLAGYDLYRTVLVPRGRGGPVTRGVCRGIWRAASLGGDRVKAQAGPLTVVGGVAAWGALLAVGFALVTWPALGEGVAASGDRETPTDFLAALYYSGFNLTTLGTGDLVPRTDVYRVLMIAEAAVGFSYLTLALTYVMSVYDALNRRNVFALGLHQRTSDTGDAATYLAGLLPGPPAAASQDLTALSGELAQLFEAHHFYPVLHYFRLPEPRYAMARILFVTLDAASLIRSAPDGPEAKTLAESAAVEALWRGGLRPVHELAPLFLPDQSPDGPPDGGTLEQDRDRWQAHYLRAAAKLRAAGVACRDDDAGFARYAAGRAEWDAVVRRFATFMDYDWDAIADPHTGG